MEEINYNGNKIAHYPNGDYVGYWFARATFRISHSIHL